MEETAALFIPLADAAAAGYHTDMRKTNNITEAEWPIMRVLWERGSATAAEIVDAVTRERDVSMRTVKTLLRRLVAKKAVAYAIDSDDSRIYHYRPLLEKNAAIREKNESFLSQVYQNKIGDLLTHFVKNEDLSREEMIALQDILREKLKGKPKR